MGFTRLMIASILALQIVLTQGVCGHRGAIINVLEGDYGEKQVGRGLESSGSVVELWLNPIWKGWSILVTSPNGITCMVYKGYAWRSLWQEVRA